MRVAAVQLNSGADRERNIRRAAELVAAAAAEGAELVVLPEKWDLLGAGAMLAQRAKPLDGAAISAARRWARELAVAIVAGSVAERLSDDDRIANTSVLIAADGAVVATYRKIHMFDVDVGGVSYRESEHEREGEEIVVADAGLGLDLGLSVCYDLRFPELFRILALRGAGLVTLPSAFTAATGEPHWEPLLRARAIENQLFMVAADQWGHAAPDYDSWGHSMVVDPWGRILAVCEPGEGLAIADLDPGEIARVRGELPSLASRRPAAYRWPAGDPAIGAHA
jgi:predicted amidohydrolase